MIIECRYDLCKMCGTYEEYFESANNDFKEIGVSEDMVDNLINSLLCVIPYTVKCLIFIYDDDRSDSICMEHLGEYLRRGTAENGS